MNITIEPSILGGCVRVPTSKSEAHRLLIAASLSAMYGCDCGKIYFVECADTNQDIDATARCLCGIGADIRRSGNGFFVTPITPESLKRVQDGAVIDCGESGSTLRFLLPVIPALGLNVKLRLHGRLAKRPLAPLDEELTEHGVKLSFVEDDLLFIGGKLDKGDAFSIRGDVSSQFVSGLLFALPLLARDCTLTVTGKMESVPYVLMTLDALYKFTDRVRGELPNFSILRSGSCINSPLAAEGDWSAAAFWLVAGAVGKRAVIVEGLNTDTRQGDSKIIDVLRSFGANIEVDTDGVTAYPSKLHGTTVDASQIPDLVPIVATLASVAEGKTKICGAERLKLKESDRLESVTGMLSALGADVTKLDDGLIIHGTQKLVGGTVDTYADHRIAMSAGIAATLCTAPVTVMGAECVAKSYPAFWEDYKALGGEIDNE